MIIRNDFTSDQNHIDKIFFFSELDSKFSQLNLSLLNTKERRKIAKKQVIGEDEKTHNVWLEVCTEIYCAFDIETSTTFGTNIVNGKEDYYSAMYCAQFAIMNNVVIFRNWNEVRRFFEKLPKLLKLSPCSVLMVWVHNLDYENSYIKHRMNIDISTYFGKNKQHPIKYLADNHFYFHDSYSVTNSSLAKLAEMYGTPHKKAKGDLDHNIRRNSQTVLTDTEIGYCANDVLVLADFSKIMFEEFLKKKGYIPDTSTQILNKELKQNALKYAEKFIGKKRYKKICSQYEEDSYMWERTILKSIHGKIFGFEWNDNGVIRSAAGIVDKHHFTSFDENGCQIGVLGKEIYGEMYYDFYEWLYRGGYTKSNARYTSTDTIGIYGLQEDIGGFDYTSSYPFCQTGFNFPVSAFEEIKISNDKLMSLELEYGCNDFEKYRHIFIITFYEIESTDDFSLESDSKCLIKGKKIIDNGRIHYADEMSVCLTDCDFSLYKKYYKWKNMTIHKAFRAEAGRLPDYLLYTLWENGLKKATLKGVECMEIEYLLAKGKFNSSYGLCVKQPIYVEYKLGNDVTATGYRTTEQINYKYIGESDIIKHSLIYNEESYDFAKEECKQLDFEDAVANSILSPYWGIWTSAFARFNLLSCMKKVSAQSEWITNDTVYCDTDSMYMRNWLQHLNIIIDWNAFAYSRVSAVLPDEYKPLMTLGQFTNIALEDSHGITDHFYNFKTLGAKRYVKSYHKIKISKHKHIKSIIPNTSATIAGLPKNTLEKFCKKNRLNIYEEFKDNMDFTIGDNPQELVKLGHKYHDELVKVNINGEIMTEYSSCTLYPNTFKLSMLPIYKQFINGILEQNGGKSYALGVNRNEKD